MAFIPTPTSNVHAKTSIGTSDVSIVHGVYKFLGCSILSVNVNIGFNGNAGSVSLTLVEDTESGDSFATPTIPSIHAISLPVGGVGAPIFYASGTSLDPNGFTPSNVPFYFCGICTSYQKVMADMGGKTISVTLADPREVLTGVQCLMGGFALSQNFSGGTPRYANVDNVIDVFGFYDYGLTSGRNEYGMLWSDIKYVLEAVQVAISGMKFEFYFTGLTFTDTPDWFRLDEQIIDIMGLVSKVAQDGGSDFICVSRKIASDACVVEFRGIQRKQNDPLTSAELDNFVNARSDIVESYRKGREFRNEPTSSVIIGGMRNANYVAYPSQYNQSMHLKADNCPGGSGLLREDYNSFPVDIKCRLFGGSGITYVEQCGNSGVAEVVSNFNVNSGAIYPFWGFTPDDFAYPLIEPFLPLEHLSFERYTNLFLDFGQIFPSCKIDVQDFNVRNVPHNDIFLTDDGDADDRPFAYISHVVTSGTKPTGYTRGLPLNTEIMRASLAGKMPFFNIFYMYYPEIAENLGFPILDTRGILEYTKAMLAAGQVPDLKEKITKALSQTQSYSLTEHQKAILNESNMTILESQARGNNSMLKANILLALSDELYTYVRQYSQENMGKKFLVCLPKSNIMQRIWDDLPVPTNPNKPQIEYIVDQRGYWTNVPPELDGIAYSGQSGIFTSDEEDQIRRKFMEEDGRFSAMVGIDWKPSGNINFNSNQRNKALFQDLSTSDYRPNRLASTPSYILSSCSVNQLVKRPDLALVDLPSPIRFDSTPSPSGLQGYNYRAGQYDEFLARKAGIVKLFNKILSRNVEFRSAVLRASIGSPLVFNEYASELISYCADKLLISLNDGITREFSTEMVMDLKGVIIPLTSTWVSYGPWYATNSQSNGMVKVEVDNSLVPWNFEMSPKASGWYANLNAAGNERLERSIANQTYLDSAVITAIGFPEYGLGSGVGTNSNLTSINVDFSAGGIKTTYSFSTYGKKPGTFRKTEFDNLSIARVDTREKLPDAKNLNIVYRFASTDYGKNEFPF